MRTVVRLLFVLAVAATLAGATPLIPGWGWQPFYWLGSNLTDPSDGFQLTATQRTEVRVVDCCLSGDQFKITVTPPGLGVLSSPVSATPVPEFGMYPEQAWADLAFSQASLFLNPGTYQIDITIVHHAAGTEAQLGQGWIEALSIPEPATFALLGAGLVGLCFLLGKRR